MNSVGSVWQKWDLHVHTPASYHWKGQRFDDQTPAQQDAACKAILDRMNELDVVTFCIMDYWFFDGYFKLRDYIRRNPGNDTKRIFPGIELRIPVAADYRLNAHVLFDDAVSEDSLRFFHSVLRFHGRPDKSLIRQNFVEIAREYDEAKLGKLNLKLVDKGEDDKMYLAALKSVLVSFESLQSAIKQMGEGTCLLVLPYDTNDGVEELDWETHLYEDHALMKAADCFEARKKIHVDLILGRGHPKNPQIGIDFITNMGGYPKPVFSGSDAHQFAEYGVFPNNRVTWLKAQPTFKGLIQVCCEPTLRCHIGDRPEKLLHVEHNPTKYIKSITLAKTATCTLNDEHWFHGKSVDLNPGLIAIIGNKGSGKSALADILALAGNSHCADLEFLTEERFRGTGNKAAQFQATLVWADETPVTVNLNDDFDPNQPERIRYLPQHFIEKLCNEITKGDNTNFNRELRKVIFNHVKEEDRLGHGSLDELLDYLVQSRKEAFAQDQQSLYTLNDAIFRNEHEMSAESIDAYEKTLALKQLELDALDKNPLTEVRQPTEDPNDVKTKAVVQQIDDRKKEHQELLTQIQQAQEERQALVAEQATLKRLSGHIDNFETYHQKFIADHTTEFGNASFDINQIVAVTVTRKPIEGRLADVTTKLAETTLLLDGKQAAEAEPEVKGLIAKAMACASAITKLQDGLNLPQREYQAYLKAKDERDKRRAAIVGATDKPETIEYYKDRVKRAKEVIPDEVSKLHEERRAIIRKLHGELLAMRDDHMKMYAAVQKIAADAAKTADSIQIEFDASVIVQGFERDFLAFW